jgi:hypothetical protein
MVPLCPARNLSPLSGLLKHQACLLNITCIEDFLQSIERLRSTSFGENRKKVIQHIISNDALDPTFKRRRSGSQLTSQRKT